MAKLSVKFLKLNDTRIGNDAVTKDSENSNDGRKEEGSHVIVKKTCSVQIILATR